MYNGVSEVSTFLIGQIGKNDKNRDKISGAKILQYACDYIEEASEIIAGHVILVELKDNPKLINFYRNNNFKLLKNSTENEEKLLQMIRII